MRYPLDGDIRINSPYGMRDSGMHWGVDLYAMPGTPVYAVDSGVVFYAAFEDAGGNHLAMYLDHPPVPEAPKAGYMHLERFEVAPGTRVNEGDILGFTDTTGKVSGPHLHFWIGTNANTGALDPMPYINPGPPPEVNWIDSNLALDAVSFRNSEPSVGDLINARVACILFYSRVSTPPRQFIDECLAFGIGVCPIFETAGLRAGDGYDAGRADGDAAENDLNGIGVPDGVRLWVNMADTPSVSPEYVAACEQYSRGFAETFPDKWALGSYGALDALRASQRGSGRFEKLWGVETWGAPHGTVDDHWNWWQGQADVALVQMANVSPPLGGTDTNWIIDRAAMKSWGGPGGPVIDWDAIAKIAEEQRFRQRQKQSEESMLINEVKDDGSHVYWLTFPDKIVQQSPENFVNLLQGQGEFMKDPPRGMLVWDTGSLGVAVYVLNNSLKQVKLEDTPLGQLGK